MADQIDENIQKMLKIDDFYKLLGVSNTETEAGIQKQYKKLALKYHPDKMNSPFAKVIFQKLTLARDNLIDPHKRAYYDQNGRVQQTQDSYEKYDFFGIYQLLNFKRAFSGLRGQIFIGLVFLILFSSFFYKMLQESPDYSLYKTKQFRINKQSQYLNVDYFVDQDFSFKVIKNADYLKNIEWKVENEYIKRLNKSCIDQKSKNRVHEDQSRKQKTKSEQQNSMKLDNQIDLSTCNQLEYLKSKYNLERFS